MTRPVGRRGVRRLAALLAVTVLVVVGVAGPVRADATRASQWHLDSLRIAQAHRLSTGAGVTVAVLDTGVDVTHPDLRGAVVGGVVMGVGGGDSLIDGTGHGTRIAGLIAARGRPGGAGALGIAPAATAVSVVIGGEWVGHIPEAVDWAVAHGATVICIAAAGGPTIQEQESVERALAADVVIVAGTGNDPDGEVAAPARYPGVIAAAGVDRAGNRATFSTAGPQAVLAAPAVDIVSTAPGGGYSIKWGTSSSTAIIAGVAALVRSKYPQLSAKEVVRRMTATAVDKGPPGRDDEYGYGIVDPVAALTADIEPEPTASPEPVARPEPGPWFTDDIRLALWIVGGALVLSLAVILAIRRTTGRTTGRTPAGSSQQQR